MSVSTTPIARDVQPEHGARQAYILTALAALAWIAAYNVIQPLAG